RARVVHYFTRSAARTIGLGLGGASCLARAHGCVAHRTFSKRQTSVNICSPTGKLAARTGKEPDHRKKEQIMTSATETATETAAAAPAKKAPAKKTAANAAVKTAPAKAATPTTRRRSP